MPSEPTSPMFTPPAARTERSFPVAAIGIAAAIVLVVVIALVLLARRHGPLSASQPLPLDPYAASIRFSDLQMSESTSLAGGKSTFLDGHVTDAGSQPITGLEVQAFFKNSEGMPPHIETVPVGLIRTRQPYIDVEAVSAEPLHPGETREFRLIFESIPDNWNTEMPELHVVRVTHDPSH